MAKEVILKDKDDTQLFPYTKASLVIMDDGSTVQEAIQEGGGGSGISAISIDLDDLENKKKDIYDLLESKGVGKLYYGINSEGYKYQLDINKISGGYEICYDGNNTKNYITITKDGEEYSLEQTYILYN